MPIRPPLSAGSVSLRLYPHNELPAERIVEELRHQGRLASQAGFDGVMTSEHHGGFAGYLPNPLQAAGWLLEAMPAGWAAPCPLLLTLRPPALVAEEIAWLAARFPDRVGLGVASGSLQADFDIMGTTKDGLTERFAAGLAAVANLLAGGEAGALAGDPAIRRCREHPVPVTSAAMGRTAVRRAAGLDVGLVLDSIANPQRVRELIDVYRQAGGRRAAILIRRVWVGPPPQESFDRQMDVYRSYSLASTQAHWKADELITGDDAGPVAERLVEVIRQTGADALNLRVTVPGLGHEAVRAQLERLGEVVALVRREAFSAAEA